MPTHVSSLLAPSSGLAASLQPPLVSDDGPVGRVDHGGVVDGGEVAVGQVKLVEPQQSWPDGFDLHVGKVLADAAVAAWRADEVGGVGEQKVQLIVYYDILLLRNSRGNGNAANAAVTVIISRQQVKQEAKCS